MKRILTLASAAMFVGAVAANAATLTVTGISGTFDNSTTTNGSAVTGDGTSSISWGTPATNAGQSGYVFDAEATPFVPVASPFLVGEFTHNNFPIFSPSLLGTELTVTVSGDVDGVAFSTFSTYSIAHTETTNASPCFPGSVSICDDIVTLGAAVNSGDAIVVDDVEYYLELSGFTSGLNFFTQENASNSSQLFAGFTTEQIVNPVPVPAGVILLGTGIAAFGVWGRKNKKGKANA